MIRRGKEKPPLTTEAAYETADGALLSILVRMEISAYCQTFTAL
jgi:hypothetical protein